MALVQQEGALLGVDGEAPQGTRSSVSSAHRAYRHAQRVHAPLIYLTDPCQF